MRIISLLFAVILIPMTSLADMPAKTRELILKKRGEAAAKKKQALEEIERLKTYRANGIPQISTSFDGPNYEKLEPAAGPSTQEIKATETKPEIKK